MADGIDINSAADQNLITSVLKCGGQIPQDLREKMRQRAREVLEDDDASPRDYNRVTRFLLADERNYLVAHCKVLDKTTADQHVHAVADGPEELRELLTEIRKNTEHADLERQRAVADSNQSGADGESRQPGTVGDGASSRAG